jgi:hypothetical protein
MRYQPLDKADKDRLLTHLKTWHSIIITISEQKREELFSLLYVNYLNLFFKRLKRTRKYLLISLLKLRNWVSVDACWLVLSDDGWLVGCWTTHRQHFCAGII